VSQPISRTESIAERIRGEILRGIYKPGERLPAERDLASRLSVNRGSVREALKKLEQLGLVTIRRGDGATVRHLHEASVEIVRHLLVVDGRVDRALLEQLLDANEMLLAGASYLAVERGSDAAIERAREIVRSIGDPAVDSMELQVRVAALVELITEASGNLVLRLFRNAFAPAMWSGMTALEPQLARMPSDSVAEALAEVDAGLAARDPEATEQAVRRLSRIRRERLVRALGAYEAEQARAAAS
jgi:GntR family transcriptional repressor for pyruvate dehydrogenase complex